MTVNVRPDSYINFMDKKRGRHLQSDLLVIFLAVNKRSDRGEIYEPFMGLKSQVELTPLRPGQLGRYWGRLN